MAVVISDFDVVLDPPPNDEAPAHAAADAPEVVLTPQELEMLLERQEERASRLRAY